MQEIDYNKMIKEYLTQEEINALKDKITKRKQEQTIEEHKKAKEEQIKKYQAAASKGLLD